MFYIDELMQKLNIATNNTLIPKHQQDIRKAMIIFAKLADYDNLSENLDEMCRVLNVQTNNTLIQKHRDDIRDCLSLYSGYIAGSNDQKRHNDILYGEYLNSLSSFDEIELNSRPVKFSARKVKPVKEM